MAPISSIRQPIIDYLVDPSKVAPIDQGQDVIQGLTLQQKTIPPHYLYDRLGSQLFEEICGLPEYYPTRTETSILQTSAPKLAQITGNCQLIELGSGSSTKTRLIIEAYQKAGYSLAYVPVDVSTNILTESAQSLLLNYPFLEVHGLVGNYYLALKNLPDNNLDSRLVCFLGSTLGNFDPKECDYFFNQVMTVLKPGDYFLLGVDLQKPMPILEAAYNDAQGITAAFNLNILQHLNWRFAGNFNLTNFKHQAFFNPEQSQIEMHLVSLGQQEVRLEKLDLTITLAAGETIQTEISRKFSLQYLQDYLQKQGLKSHTVWTDNDQWFALLLTQATNQSDPMLNNTFKAPQD